MTGVFVHVRVAGEMYALSVDDVREVVELDAIEHVPGAPRAVLGICNRRGAVLPVVDLGAALGGAAAGRARAVVVEHEGGLAGLAVDSVLDVREISAHDPAPPDSAALRGTVLVDGDLVGILDVERLLASVNG